MTGTVTIVEHGRDGTVRYAQGGRTIDGYWEFGGGDVVTIVQMGSRDDWARSHGWAVASRASILQIVAGEAIRQRAPTCVATIDQETGVILLRRRPGTAQEGPSARAVAQEKAAGFVRRYADIRSMAAWVVLAIAALAGGIMWFGNKTQSVAQGHGVPLNECVRFGDPSPGGIACLIQRTDPQLPNWTGRGGGETVSASVLIVPLDGSPPRHVPAVSGLAPSSLSLARIMGCDGQTLWFDVAGLYGVRLANGGLVTPKDLQEANPSLDPSWWDDQRNMDVVDGRLHVMRRDRSAALDVDPATLSATPAPPKPSKARLSRTAPDDFLTDARGVASTFRNPAYVRSDAQGKQAQLKSPAGVLMVHEASLAEGTLMVSRMDASGQAVWTANTGLDRSTLQQILPGENAVAFVGTAPAVPGHLSEPMVVLVENETGRVLHHTLWR